MTLEAYKQAHKLQEEISKLVYELEVMEQNLLKPTSIRFGTAYNVSIPIEFDSNVYTNAIKRQMDIHKENLQQIKNQFNNL